VTNPPPTPEIFSCLEKIELKKKYISTLRRLSDWQRNAIGKGELNVHREVDSTAEEVVNKFAEKRRQFYL